MINCTVVCATFNKRQCIAARGQLDSWTAAENSALTGAANGAMVSAAVRWNTAVFIERR